MSLNSKKSNNENINRNNVTYKNQNKYKSVLHYDHQYEFHHYIRWYFFIKKAEEKNILIKYYKAPLILINKYTIKNKKQE